MSHLVSPLCTDRNSESDGLGGFCCVGVFGAVVLVLLLPLTTCRVSTFRMMTCAYRAHGVHTRAKKNQSSPCCHLLQCFRATLSFGFSRHCRESPYTCGQRIAVELGFPNQTRTLSNLWIRCLIQARALFSLPLQSSSGCVSCQIFEVTV